jgi:polysaccharide export outer membrane protein
MMTIRRFLSQASFAIAALLVVLPTVAQQRPAPAQPGTRAAPAAPATPGQAAPGQAAPAAAAPGALPATGASYRLAAGDAIRINVFQSPELSVDARLTETGAISYPLLGTVQLGGLTVSESEKKTADQLRTRDFVKQPQVSILVTQVRGHQVTVLGQVGRPGRYPLESGEVLLTEMLATAGGVQATGGDTVLVVGTRNGRPFRTEVDLPTVYAKQTGDVVLQNGDSIYIDRAPQIYVEGEVGRPGPVRLERNMTVRQALSVAGGITLRGTERGMKVHRKDASGKVQEISVRMTDTLQPDDVVHVKESLF